MIVEGVTFNVAVIKEMKKEDFISECMKVHWQDRDEKTRKKMLSDVYDSIVKPEKEKE